VIDEASFRAKPVDPSSDDVCLITGATGFIGGHLAQRLVGDGYRVRCLVRASSDTSLLDELDVEIAVGDLTKPRSLARAADGCSYAFHCGARVSDWATVEEITRINVQGTRNLLEACVDASVRRVIHFSTTDVYGYPGRTAIDETHVATRFRNWYAQSKLGAEAEVRRVEKARELAVVILRPATVYGPRSTDVIGEIARAMRGGNMLLVNGGRAIAGLCYVDNLVDAAVLALRGEAAAGNAFNVSDGLDVTWRKFTDDLAEGLGCPHVRWSLPYGMANAIGFSLEHGYRFLRRTTRLNTQPLLSRQAVHVLGTDQDFSNRKAREMLGWEPRIDYATGFEATLAWLQARYLEH
jgi:nucleoside-diphosphate-sugar epimerase